ncbi:hypothetical protein ACERZ8_18925 [Tateyamaria armeniaca]|uniref:Uncharacterized protein n=1 Tax=Tateyamaria armeniaca TaxID=2518930 RepID=A0ABW8UXG4_9RHOB
MPIMEQTDIDSLKANLAKARKADIPFGVCLGKKPENTVMYLDKQKSSDVLLRRAKKAGETSKAVGGKVGIEGKKAILTLEGDALPGMARTMRTFLLTIGMKMNIVIMDASGSVLEADGDEEPDAGGPTAAAEPVTDDPAVAEWVRIEPVQQGLVDTFTRSGDARAPAIVKAWASAQVAAKKGNHKAAIATANKIRPVIEGGGTPAETAEDPNKAKWQAMQGPMVKLYEAVMARNPPDRAKISAAWGMATEKADADQFAAAIMIAEKIKPLMEKATSAEGTGQQAEVPKDVVPFQKSRVIWVKTRNTMFAEMKKLEKAIKAACGEEQALQEVAERASTLTGRLRDFDDSLQTILDAITNTPDGAERAKLKRAAAQKVAQYQSLLQQPFFKDVDTNNGFVEVTVARAAVSSLGAIGKVLAA